ncbi:MAG: pyridoxal-phosphate dependent enzyme [Alphaproteobacteria bacterium]|nr:pyridoxal-phosphate dependent enzyme [Alphaproteobacteria bacterium]MCB9928909.1 pyridoxal-phosphate dependent enzyme [Alphaproteobacteria bacterium]
MSDHPVDLAMIEAAAQRIRGRVRETPVLDPQPMRGPVLDAGRLLLKLECLQVTGSFKARGASNKLATLDANARRRGLVTASGGNHGLAVAYAAASAGVPAAIFVPESTPAAKVQKLRQWGAEVTVTGRVWDEAQEAALAAQQARGLAYVHPFADPEVIAGQGTLGLEILRQVPHADTLVVAIGGGGLIAGIAAAAKAIRPGIRIVGVEPTGAPTLYESLKAGALVTLDAIETASGSLAPRRSMPINLDLIAAHVDRMVLVTDEEMRRAAEWLWFETGVAAELAGAASLAALMTGRHRPAADETVVAVICGAGTDGLGLAA